MQNKKDAIIRLVLLTLAVTNQTLVMLGRSPLPFEDDTIVMLLSAGFTIVTSLWAYWKNNSFTKEAVQADEVLQILRDKTYEEE
jgi:SPP1 family holin